MQGGIEWLVDAYGCTPAKLCDRAAVLASLDAIVATMNLTVVGKVDHVFPDPGGITAIYMLAESHLAIHTFPETATITLNIYCCAPRPPAAWRELLAETLGAKEVVVTEIARGKPA